MLLLIAVARFLALESVPHAPRHWSARNHAGNAPKVAGNHLILRSLRTGVSVWIHSLVRGSSVGLNILFMELERARITQLSMCLHAYNQRN